VVLEPEPQHCSKSYHFLYFSSILYHKADRFAPLIDLPELMIVDRTRQPCWGLVVTVLGRRVGGVPVAGAYFWDRRTGADAVVSSRVKLCQTRIILCVRKNTEVYRPQWLWDWGNGNLVVNSFDCQCNLCASPRFDSISDKKTLSGVADPAVLNKVHKNWHTFLLLFISHTFTAECKKDLVTDRLGKWSSTPPPVLRGSLAIYQLFGL